MWDLAESVNNLDLINRVDRWRQAAMNAEYLVADHNTQRQIVEHVCEIMPDIGTPIFSCALSVETIRLCNTSRLVIPSDEVYATRPP